MSVELYVMKTWKYERSMCVVLQWTCVLICLLLLVAEIIKYFKTVLFLNSYIATNILILEKPIVVLHWQIVWKTPVEIWCFKFRSITHMPFRCHFSTCVFTHFADANQLSGFSINRTLAENKVIQQVLSIEANKKFENNSDWSI